MSQGHAALNNKVAQGPLLPFVRLRGASFCAQLSCCWSFRGSFDFDFGKVACAANGIGEIIHPRHQGDARQSSPSSH